MKYALSTIFLPNKKGVTFFFKNKKRGISKNIVFSDTHPNFSLACNWYNQVTATDLFFEKRKVYDTDFKEISKLADIRAAMTAWSRGSLTINRRGATYKGKSIDPELESLLVKVFLADPKAEDTFDAWTQYLEISTGNDVSYKVATRLFMFLKQNDLSISSTGKVLAWKVVRPNYRDKHSNTFDNSVGKFVEVPRSEVDDDDTRYCSKGLHICSWNYLRSFASKGDPVMQVELDIKDIIAIPLDYAGEKVRCSKYRVVAEAGKWGEDVDANRLPTTLIQKGFTAKV